MSERRDDLWCPNHEALLVVGVVPQCQSGALDPAVLMLLAECAACDQPKEWGVPAFLLRATSCEDAFGLMEEVRDGRR